MPGSNNQQESRAVAWEPHDVAAVFGLKKVRRQHSLQVSSFESHASELQTYRHKTEFNAKWPF